MSDESFLIDPPGQEGEGGAQTPEASGENNGGGWLDGLPDDLKGLAEHKGWREPADALKSYSQLEGFMGAEKAGRGLVLPKDDEDTEAYEKIYAALGRPESPDDYGLKEVFDYEVDENLFTGMSGAMHKAGLSSGQAKALAEAYHNYESSLMKDITAQKKAELDEARRTISAETTESARRALRFLGLPREEDVAEADRGDTITHEYVAQALEQTLGYRLTSELMSRFGELLPGDKAPGSERGGFIGSSTGAKARMDNLLNDKSFNERYLSGDQSAINEISKLAERATSGN